MSSVLSQCLLQSVTAPTTQTTIYGPVPTAARVKLDKYTVYNPTANVQTYEVHLVAAGGAAGAGNKVGVASIQPNETYNFPWVVGHDLNPGDFISVVASDASMTHRITGRVTTS